MTDTRTVLVTGPAKGIGRGIAERFLEAGYAAVLFDIDRDELLRVWGPSRTGGSVLPIAGDAAEEDDVRAAVSQAIERFGRLDALVNNAGIEIAGRVDQLTAAQWDRQIAVNLKSAFLFSRHVVPCMRGRGGAIVNISSVHAFYAYPGCAAYDASKAGMIGLTRAMALDHGPDGIRVNAVCPGYIRTPLLEQWLSTLPDRESALREVLKAHPLGRIGTPRDIAEAVFFLASDAASFISGTCLIVDGAMTAPGH
ncbi:MAG: SDR family oxidoreductase [Bryobacterales bacterium]|nr:SDR family oxidoreductase [Bryobacterales bacterium]